MTRRRALWLGLASLTGIVTQAGCRAMRPSYPIQALEDPARDFTVLGEAYLRERAAAKGLIYGAASGYEKLTSDTKFTARFIQECGILVPEGELKWTALRPSPDKFDFTLGDWLSEFAHTNGMLFRGHTLVWNQSLPEWFKDTVNSKNAEQILTHHIKTVAGHYAGKIHSWDVVNESVSPEHGRPDGLTVSPWLNFLGVDYIALAFRTARQADPQALLCLNEAVGGGQDDNFRREAILTLLQRLLSQGTPIQALGIESHLGGRFSNADLTTFRGFLHDAASLGLKILITELDVIDKDLPLDMNVRDRMVAAVYEDYLSVVLEEPAVIAVLTWGLSDRYTWHSTYNPREDKAPVRPLPLDAQLKRKLAWNAMARAFDNASRHRTHIPDSQLSHGTIRETSP
ncbi:MAG TPA: endo-1,4-beta-xylanase [Allocoleopsis sp.]